MTVRLTPPTLRQPRLEHVRDLWQMHRPRNPKAVLIAAIYETDTGRELRVGFSLTNLIHSELSRTDEDALLARAEILALGAARQSGPSRYGQDLLATRSVARLQ